MYFDLIGALFSSCAFSWEPKNARGEDLVYILHFIRAPKYLKLPN